MLVINLRDPKILYRQGDEVAGQAIYQPTEKDPSLVEVQIELLGRLKSQFKGPGSGLPYFGQAILIRKTVVQTRGSQKVWPFSFNFPAQASPPDGMQGVSKQMTTVAPDHPLPPSFNDTIGLSISPHFQGYIEYLVVATVWAPSPQGAKRIAEQGVVIEFEPRYDTDLFPNSTANPADVTKSCTVKSVLLLPENKGRDLSFQEKVGSMFNRSKLPQYEFEATLTVPTRGHLHEPLQCTLSITPVRESEGVADKPKVVLKQYRMRVVGETVVFTPGVVDDGMQNSRGVVHEVRKNGLSDLIAGETTIDVSPAQGIKPTFVTFNIIRRYMLDAEVKIECAGKSFTLVSVGPLTILPSSLLDGGGEEKMPAKGEKSTR